MAESPPRHPNAGEISPRSVRVTLDAFTLNDTVATSDGSAKEFASDAAAAEGSRPPAAALLVTGTGAATDAASPPAGVSEAANPITIYVCVTCRGGRPLDLVPVPGEVLAEATAQAAAGTGMSVRTIRCLANCNRGLSAAVRRDGAWTYVFGGLDPATGAGALVEGAKLFAESPDGLMPWRGRPEALKRGLVARTPPFGVTGDS
jgi:predicted metal-binding protein